MPPVPTPGYAAGPASYALTLRQLHCYEASNREAFAALAYDPSRVALYGLIGQNMIALGHRQEGLDAFSLYFNAPDDGQTVPAPWDGDVYEMEEAYWEPPVKRRARLNGLMHMILSRMARGDMDGASRALQRARRAPFQAPYARRDELAALWHERAGRPQEALRYVRRALRLRPYDAQLSASAACLLGRLGRAGEAASALTRAAVCASTPADELLVCLASEQLGAHEAAYAMLSRSLKRCSGRYPVLYDLAVCLLKLGRLEEASRSIHLCRELDPDDVPGEVLFNRVMDMETRALTPDQVRAEAASVSYYGSLNEEELNRCLKPVTQAVREGPGALGRRHGCGCEAAGAFPLYAGPAYGLAGKAASLRVRGHAAGGCAAPAPTGAAGRSTRVAHQAGSDGDARLHGCARALCRVAGWATGLCGPHSAPASDGQLLSAHDYPMPQPRRCACAGRPLYAVGAGTGQADE